MNEAIAMLPERFLVGIKNTKNKNIMGSNTNPSAARPGWGPVLKFQYYYGI